MPIITVQFIKDVVATPEQKDELVVRLTDTFVDILGEVVRPFVYCLIEETPQQEWGIAGVPMPDLAYLTGEEHAGVVERSNSMMRDAIAAMAAGEAAATAEPAQPAAANARADRLWRGEIDDLVARAQPPAANARADRLWRGEIDLGGAMTEADSGSAATHAAEHRALFERWFEELWNKKNYAIAHELVDPDFVAHGAGGQDIKQGPDGVIGMVKAWHAAMPDGRMTIDDIITEGEMSTIRMTWRATHTGQFGDIPASGNEIEVTSTGIDRVVDGKITEGWGELNMLGMLQQMGAIPSPDPAPAAANDVDKAARNKANVLRMYEETNKGNIDVIFEVLAPEFVSYGGAGFEDIHGPKAFIEFYNSFVVAFPDLQFEVQHIAADGDLVIARGIQTATHLGNFMGMAPPTGKKVVWPGTATFRFNDEGRAVERWLDLDNLDLLQQLEAIPVQGEGSVGPSADEADRVWRGEAATSNGSAASHAAEHRALFERWFEELWNKKNYAIAHELVDPDFVAHGAGGQDIKQGPDGVIGMVKAWHAAMPDGRMTIDDIITEGEMSTIRMTWRATHTGQFGDIPASGNEIEVTSTGIDRVVDGKITEGWGELNMLGMLQQMGAIPSPDPAPAAGNGSTSGSDEADRVWRGEAATSNGSAASHAAEHRALFERWFEELWNKKNYAIAHELVDPDFVAHGAGGQDIKQGPDGVIGMVKAWHAAMPDGRMTIDDIITEGEMSTIRMTWRATHTGQFGDIPASGNEIEVTSTGIDRVVDGKITEGWGELNMLGMLQQMGAIPTPEAAQGQGPGSPGPDPGTDDPVQSRNRRTVQRFFDTVSDPRLDGLQEIFAAEFTNHGGSDGVPVGLAGLVDSLLSLRRALPDYQVTPEYVVAEGDRVAVRTTVSGTHRGSFLDEEPTGKRISWTEQSVFRLDQDGKIAEFWQDVDRVGMLMQIGVIPAPTGVSA